MKNITIQLIALLFLGTGTIFAQDLTESQVPAVVVTHFKTKFPKAKDVEWEKKGDQYSVDFEIGWGTDYEAWYTSSGKLINYKMEVSETNLPQEVKDAVHSNYPGFRINDVKKYVENGIETYHIEIEKGKDERKVILSKDGKLI